MLHQRQPHDRLRTVQQLVRFVEVEFVVQAWAALGHTAWTSSNPGSPKALDE
jgi:hypothetical protein